MLVVQRPLNVIDSCIGHSTAFHDLQPLLRGLLLDTVFDQAVDHGSVLYAVSVG